MNINFKKGGGSLQAWEMHMKVVGPSWGLESWPRPAVVGEA